MFVEPELSGMNSVIHTDSSDRYITRLKSINIEGFRGFREKQELNTDAEIVLINGPNGFGKTSLIDALCLLLNGYYYENREPLLFCCDEDKKPGRLSAQVLHANGKKPEEIYVRIPVEHPKKPIEFGGPVVINNDFVKQEMAARSSFFYQDLLLKLFDEEAGVSLRDFLAPLPPQVEQARKTVGATNKEFGESKKRVYNIPGIPDQEEIDQERNMAMQAFIKSWDQLCDRLKKMNMAIPDRIENLWFINSGNKRSNWQGELRNWVNELSEKLIDVEMERLPQDVAVESCLQRLLLILDHIESQLAEQAKNNLNLDAIIEMIPYGVSILLGDKLEAAVQFAQDLQKQITADENKFKKLQALERYFQNPNGPALLEILLSLEEQGPVWLNLPNTIIDDIADYKEIMNWLEDTVNIIKVKGLTQKLSAWETSIRQQRTELQQAIYEKQENYRIISQRIRISQDISDYLASSQELQEINNQLMGKRKITKESLAQLLINKPISPINEVVQLLDNNRKDVKSWLEAENKQRNREEAISKMESTHKSRDYLDKVQLALNKESFKTTSLLENVVKLPDAQAEQLSVLVSGLLARFRTVEGLCPVTFRPDIKGQGRAKSNIWIPHSNDNRPLSAFSTGQQAQLALALLLSLNITLQAYIRHHIIALDDSTTAFDMAQLPREAALLRQIAYGSGNTNSFTRRQLFITSHHEDLTNRLLDYLIPPQGSSLRILNFVGWDPQKGPQIEQYSVEPACSVSAESRDKFGQTFAAFLKNWD